MNFFKVGKLTVLAFMLLTAFITNAQVSIGVKGGVSFNNVHATQALDNVLPNLSSVDAFSYGLVSEIEINENFAIQPELVYNKKGFGYKLGTDVDLFGINVPLGVTAETQINYLDVPLLAKYKFSGEGISAYVTAGPTIGYAVDGQLVTRANALIDFNLSQTPINLEAINFQRLEVSGTVGAGLELKTTMGKVFVDGRYNHGFTQLYDIPLVNERLSNRGFSLQAGVMFPIGG